MSTLLICLFLQMAVYKAKVLFQSWKESTEKLKANKQK